jgi:peptidoglycan hydrolase-like protein with peptidoglycan-binding domain
VKIHCSVLAEDAIKAAIRDYQQKHGIATEGEPIFGPPSRSRPPVRPCPPHPP